MLFAILAITFVSCSDDDDTTPVVETTTTFDIIADSPNHNTLEQLLVDNNLDQVLNDGTFTVFAPTDDAFSNIDTSGLTADEVTNILLNHVITGSFLSTDLSTGYASTNATVDGNNYSIYVDTENGVLLNGSSNVSNADITSDNGTVHVVDQVITLPSLATFVTADSQLSTLETALTDSGLVNTIENGIFTVFAPTDNAFSGATLPTNDAEVSNLLLNHTVLGNVLSTDLSNGYFKTNAIENYSGDDNNVDLYANVDNGVVINGSANVEFADIIASNGAIHKVDAVIEIPTIVELAAANPMFSNLATALTQEDLIGTLSTDAGTSPAPFTVFAPNNTAFQNFLDDDPNDNFETIDDVLNLSFLSDVLTYHVLPNGAVRAADITDGITPTTVQSETFTINAMNGVSITDSNARETNVIATDVTGSNGVIHVLDNVLLPTLP